MKKHKIILTMGDPSGIGAEITVKALNHPELYELCTPIVVGDFAAMEDALRITGCPLTLRKIASPAEAGGTYGTIDLIDLGILTPGSWTYGATCKISGEASFRYITTAIALAMDRGADGVVTAPISKEAIHLAGHHYSGHTEIFADHTHTSSYGMLLTSGALRVIHVTTHVSMRDACDIIRSHPERVENAIRLAADAMEQLGISHPRIAVAGLNAHSSENGLFGDEEAVSIIPAIQRARDSGLNVDGPIPPDTVFVKALAGAYDVVVAMYHDQGHIPLKLSGFRMDPETGNFTSVSGVNSTIGLPIIRTSVDHGTAYDRAGKGNANEESMLDAVRMAVTMADKRFPLD